MNVNSEKIGYEKTESHCFFDNVRLRFSNYNVFSIVNNLAFGLVFSILPQWAKFLILNHNKF